jgi:hypothetical protein
MKTDDRQSLLLTTTTFPIVLWYELYKPPVSFLVVRVMERKM